MTDGKQQAADMEKLIEAEAVDENESRATKQLYSALMENRKALSGGGKVAETDQAFSEQLHREASRRSAEISAYQNSSSRLKPVDGDPVPKWVLAAWVVAIAGVIGLFWWLVAGP